MATPTYTPIETYTLGSPATTVTFGAGNTLPQTYTDLVIVLQGTQDSSYSARNMGIRFNGDTGSNYCAVQVLNASAGTDTNLASLYGPLINSSTNTTSGVFADGIINVQNYSNSTTYKSIICYGGTAAQYTSGGSNVGTYVGFNASTWLNTNPVTQITLYASNVSGPGSGANWAAGSTFTLYGIANSNIGAPKATGGIITYDNTYYYHTFGASGTFTPQQSLTADILVVAGGGSGGQDHGGGGGAGGVLAFASQSLSATGYTVTVGAGGAASGSRGNNGSDSQFGALTLVKGGGGGGSYTQDAGLTGGSGGGAGADRGSPNSGGSATSGQGYAGGNSSNGANGAGGGGAGAVGANTSNNALPGGTGGIGLNTWSSWALVTGTGDSGYYASGGGGGSDNQGPSGTALGGGGRGGSSNGSVYPPVAGKANTGGGGGGSGYTVNSAAGGSGIVIVRYLKA